MRIQHNIAAMNSYRNYNINAGALNKNLEKLSSGYKINRAGDDAAGLAISEKMRAQITGLETATKNVKDGISLVKTAEGALQEVHDMLNRMEELAVQSANGTYDDKVDRANLQKEVDALKTEIDRIADSSNFNGIKLLDGSLGGGGGSSSGVSYTGSKVFYAEAAKVNSASLKADFSSTIDTSAAGKDFLRIDGQGVEIDWENDAEAAELAAQLTADLSSVSDEGFDDIAKKLESIINNAAKKQGVSGSVKVTNNAGTLTIKSNSKEANSEISFLGSNAADGDQSKSVMANILEGTSAKGVASINEATLKYNGKAVTAADTDEFNMVINGVSVNVSVAIAADTDIDTAVGALEAAIDTAIGSYNTALGLTANTEDSKSGLTGLDPDDFTVKKGDNGNFIIEYTGDEEVEFHFENVGTRTSATELGLANGSSTSGGGGLDLQIGDTSDGYNKMSVSIDNMHASALGISSVDISNQSGASAAVDKVKEAINKVSMTRGTLGATQNRLEHTQKNLSVMTENIQDAESTIRDTDVAAEMMEYTKNNILLQSAQAMLAQANQQPQGVLQLLG